MIVASLMTSGPSDVRNTGIDFPGHGIWIALIPAAVYNNVKCNSA